MRSEGTFSCRYKTPLEAFILRPLDMSCIRQHPIMTVIRRG